jgi:hypothetical protein
MIQSDHDRGRYSPIAFGRTEFVPGNISHPDLFCPSYERVRQLLKAKHRTATGGSSTPLGAGSETEVAYRNAGRSVFCRRENRMGTIELWNSTRSCEICCPRALQPSCRRSCSRPAELIRQQQNSTTLSLKDPQTGQINQLQLESGRPGNIRPRICKRSGSQTGSTKKVCATM